MRSNNPSFIITQLAERPYGLHNLRIDLEDNQINEQDLSNLNYYYNPSAKTFPSDVQGLGLAHDQIELLQEGPSKYSSLTRVCIEPQYSNSRCIDLTPLAQFDLEHLDASDARLSFQDDGLPEGLTALYLSKEMFLKFQDMLPKSLKFLSLTGYQLTDIPQCIYKLPNLTHLDLSGNNLSQLPKEPFTLTQLKLLNLSGNDIQNPEQA